MTGGVGQGAWGLESFRFRCFALPAGACPHAGRLRTVPPKPGREWSERLELLEKLFEEGTS